MHCYMCAISPLISIKEEVLKETAETQAGSGRAVVAEAPRFLRTDAWSLVAVSGPQMGVAGWQGAVTRKRRNGLVNPLRSAQAHHPGDPPIYVSCEPPRAAALASPSQMPGSSSPWKAGREGNRKRAYQRGGRESEKNPREQPQEAKRRKSLKRTVAIPSVPRVK